MNWKMIAAAALALGVAACDTNNRGGPARSGSPAAVGLNRAPATQSTGGTTTVQEPGTGVSTPESNPGRSMR